MAVIDGITLGAKEARTIIVSGVDVGLSAEDAQNIVLIADSFDPEAIVAVGMELRYDERVLDQFAGLLLQRLDLFSDVEPEAPLPDPAPGLTTTTTLAGPKGSDPEEQDEDEAIAEALFADESIKG